VSAARGWNGAGPWRRSRAPPVAPGAQARSRRNKGIGTPVRSGPWRGRRQCDGAHLRAMAETETAHTYTQYIPHHPAARNRPLPLTQRTHPTPIFSLHVPLANTTDSILTAPTTLPPFFLTPSVRRHGPVSSCGRSNSRGGGLRPTPVVDISCRRFHRTDADDAFYPNTVTVSILPVAARIRWWRR
jgi:hypothetical protein